MSDSDYEFTVTQNSFKSISTSSESDDDNGTMPNFDLSDPFPMTAVFTSTPNVAQHTPPVPAPPAQQSESPPDRVQASSSSAAPRFPSLSVQDLGKLRDGGKAPRTERKTKWAITVYNKWRKERSIAIEIEDMDEKELNANLSYFFAEVRKENGEEYRPNTLYEMMMCLQRYLREKGKYYLCVIAIR